MCQFKCIDMFTYRIVTTKKNNNRKILKNENVVYSIYPVVLGPVIHLYIGSVNSKHSTILIFYIHNYN